MGEYSGLSLGKDPAEATARGEHHRHQNGSRPDKENLPQKIRVVFGMHSVVRQRSCTFVPGGIPEAGSAPTIMDEVPLPVLAVPTPYNP